MSGVVTLLVDSQPLSVFCHMGNFGCGDGGWTPVMKIDGRKVPTFIKKFISCINPLSFKTLQVKNVRVTHECLQLSSIEKVIHEEQTSLKTCCVQWLLKKDEKECVNIS